MSDTSRRGAHTVCSIHRHLVWMTMYRRADRNGDVGMRMRELIREIGAQADVVSINGHGAQDHGHRFVSIPLQVTIRRLVQRLNGKSASKLFHEFPHLRKTFWGRPMWARGSLIL